MARRTRRSAPASHAELAEQVLASALPPTPEPEVDEVTEQLDESTPPESEQPTKPAGTSNLAQTIRKHRHRYAPALHPVSGKKTANNGDPVARILLGCPLNELARFTRTHFGTKERPAIYSHLNTGHERMCCGNLVRAAWKKGDEVVEAWLAERDAIQNPVEETEEA